MQTVTVDGSLEYVSEMLVAAGLAKSKGEAKRLIEGGGVYINDEKITDAFAVLPDAVRKEGEFILHKGKKSHLKIILK